MRPTHHSHKTGIVESRRSSRIVYDRSASRGAVLLVNNVLNPSL